MPMPFVPPKFETAAFNCPLCHAYAHQYWAHILRKELGNSVILPDYRASRCSHCSGWLMWHDQKIVVPDVTSAPVANEDLDEEIRKDYAEAASIVAKSPRGAAGL